MSQVTENHSIWIWASVRGRRGQQFPGQFPRTCGRIALHWYPWSPRPQQFSAFLRTTAICSWMDLRRAFPVVLVVKNPPANAGDIGEEGLIPESGRSPGGGNGNPLQYSYLENPMDKGAWQAAVHRVTQSGIQLKWFSTHAGALEEVFRLQPTQNFCISWKWKVKVKVAQLCPTLCNPIDCTACQAPLSIEVARPKYWSG